MEFRSSVSMLFEKLVTQNFNFEYLPWSLKKKIIICVNDFSSNSYKFEKQTNEDVKDFN